MLSKAFRSTISEEIHDGDEEDQRGVSCLDAVHAGFDRHTPLVQQELTKFVPQLPAGCTAGPIKADDVFQWRAEIPGPVFSDPRFVFFSYPSLLCTHGMGVLPKDHMRRKAARIKAAGSR